jgi:hypothetical protein
MKLQMRADEHRNWFDSCRLHLSLSLIALCVVFSQGCGDSVEQTTNAYIKARPGADEAAIAMTLKQIASAQQNYLLTRASNSYGTFDQLVEAGFLDARFKGSAPVTHGYVFNMKLVEARDGQSPSFSVNADPQPSRERPVTGTRHYYLDSSASAIRVNPDRPATASDAPLP